MFFSSPSNALKLNDVFDHKDQGIPEKDLLAFEKYADGEDVILLFRPVEPLTKTLHEAGQNPTKNFKIKGKSSSWGLWAGFIPIEQYYSKLNGVSNAIIEIEKANREIQDCIQKQYAQSTQLIITEERYQELRKQGIIFPQKKKEGEYLVIYCPHPHIDQHPSKLELSYAKKIHTESGAEYAIYTAEKQAFNVLADTILKRSLIADYDPLAFWEPWKNYGPDNKRPNQEITHKERCRKLSPKEKRRSKETAENFYAREDPNLGNVAPITKKHITGLNKALDKGYALERFHHNDDVGSPVSKPAANYPITAIIPPMEGFNSMILLLETPEEFVDFINKVNTIGYFRVMANPLWELPVKWAAIRNYFFYKIQIAYLKDKRMENMELTLKEMFKTIDLNDATMIKELNYLFKLMTDANFKSDTLFTKFFDIIQSSLFVNSTMVVKFCRSLKILLDYKALSENKIDQLLTMNKILRKKNVQGFYEILDVLHFLPGKDVKIIDDYFNLAETNIYNNGLDRAEFEKSLQKFTSKFKVAHTATFGF